MEILERMERGTETSLPYTDPNEQLAKSLAEGMYRNSHRVDYQGPVVQSNATGNWTGQPPQNPPVEPPSKRHGVRAAVLRALGAAAVMHQGGVHGVGSQGHLGMAGGDAALLAYARERARGARRSSRDRA